MAILIAQTYYSHFLFPGTFLDGFTKKQLNYIDGHFGESVKEEEFVDV